jgi:hypothetical protein
MRITALEDKAGGTLGNRRLTSAAGLVLLILLFCEGLTLPLIHRLLVLHIFIGFLLLPPLALKLGSTGFRFAMYYLRSLRYRTAGPPALPLRLLAPVLVISTVLLMWSGVELVIAGPDNAAIWRRMHIVSFVLWFGLMTVHMLAHALRATGEGLSDLVPRALPAPCDSGALWPAGFGVA